MSESDRRDLEDAELWRAWFPSGPPVGYLLRRAIPSQWFRIHSLPGSRRYPDGSEDEAILLGRHSSITQEILGGAGRIRIYHLRYGGGGIPRSKEVLRLSGIELRRLAQLDLTSEDLGEEEIQGEMFSAEQPWPLPGFESLVLQVANDQVRHLLLLNPESGNAYSPYDGGADLFFSDQVLQASLKQRNEAWLSPYSHGL